MRTKPGLSMSSNTAWAILLLSAVCEAVWATALGHSNGFAQPVAVVIFFVALVASMGGLAIAMNEISIGTAYAVWTGIGAVLTVLYATLTGTEAMSPLKAVFLIGIVGCTAGLKFMGHGDEPETHNSEPELE